MSKIINKNFFVGDKFVGLINGASFLVLEVGKDQNFYGTASGNCYQNDNIYVHFKELETGRKSQTILANAQRLLLKKCI